MNASEKIVKDLCEILAKVTDNQFQCFCGENKIAIENKHIDPRDKETLTKIEDILLENEEYIISHL